MPTIFPDLLTYSFFAPTLLRIVAAAAMGYVAYTHYIRRDELGREGLPFIGRIGVWPIYIAIPVETLIALALLFGYYTQLAALLAAGLALKHFVYAKKYPRLIPLCRTDYVFLFVICVSLMLTGAGALAFDLRL